MKGPLWRRSYETERLRRDESLRTPRITSGKRKTESRSGGDSPEVIGGDNESDV